MSVTTTPNLTVGPGVSDFLRRNNAEASFQTACELIRECFPDARTIKAELQEDCYEPDERTVGLAVALPDSLPLEVWIDQNRHYHERLSERIPPTHASLFIKSHEFSAE